MTVFHTLVSFFHLNQIDFTVKQEKFKLKCVSYKNGSRLPFIVRIFTVDSSLESKQYAVEFQRRSGDIIAFSDIYRGCKSHLEREGYTATTTSKLAVRTAPPPLDVQVTVDQARDTMKCLLSMAGSDCADVKAKAMEALTEMSREDGKVQHMMVKDGGLDMFIESLESSYEDVHRSAVSGVANLTKDHEVASRQVMDNASDSLYKLAHSETPQVVRESARALENIGCALGKGAIDLKFRQTLDVLTYSKDSIAQSYASRLVQTLGI